MIVTVRVDGSCRAGHRGGSGRWSRIGWRWWRHVEDQRQVQGVGADGEGFVEDPVPAETVEVDAGAVQVPVEARLGNGGESKGCILGDQDVPVECVRPDGSALIEPGP